MEQDMANRIIKEYDEKIRLYSEFGEKLKLLLQDILRAKTNATIQLLSAQRKSLVSPGRY